MKKMLLFSFMLTFLFGSMSCDAQNKQDQQKSEKALSEKVEVIYFHYSRRCLTCNTVESEAKKHLETLYPELVKNGKITFASINLEEAESKAIADRSGATGQSLLVVSGDKRADLTRSGFMFARSQPERFKTEIKSAIDPMIK
jgi:hypothetical protein